MPVPGDDAFVANEMADAAPGEYEAEDAGPEDEAREADKVPTSAVDGGASDEHDADEGRAED